MDFLLAIAFVWLLAASITDLKKREVSDWLSFSLLAIALCFKTAESAIAWDYHPILNASIGLLAFFVLANILYYGKLFAGGDAKLLIALGPIIPSASFISNILVAGSAYGIIYSIVLAFLNRREFMGNFRKHFRAVMIFLAASFAIFIAYLLTDSTPLLLISGAMFFMPLLFYFVNAVEKACLIRKVSPKELTVGDWLFKDVRVRGKVVKSDFEGLTKQEINLLRKSKSKVYVKYGIPFIPVFLIAFVMTIVLGNIFYIFI